MPEYWVVAVVEGVIEVHREPRADGKGYASVVRYGRGDVVVFWYPRDPAVSFIKRVVGLPGDLVEIRAGQLLVNGLPAREGYLPESFRDGDSYPPTEVRKGYYFVLGDHRRSSNDSRSWGEVPERYIYGRAVFRFWPFARVGPIR